MSFPNGPYGNGTYNFGLYSPPFDSGTYGFGDYSIGPYNTAFLYLGSIDIRLSGISSFRMFVPPQFAMVVPAH